MKVLKFLQKLFVAIWVGKIVFFAAAIAPNVFRILSREDAAALQGSIFPTYFAMGLVCTLGVLTTTALLKYFKHQPLKPKRVIALSLLASATYAYLLFVLMPQILAIQPEVLQYAKDAQVEIVQEFATLHKLSTSLNLVALVLGLIVLFFI